MSSGYSCERGQSTNKMITLVVVFSDDIEDLRAFGMRHRTGLKERAQQRKERIKRQVKVPLKKLTNNWG